MITIRYDAEADTLDITLGPARGRVTTEEVGEHMLVDLDPDGRPVSVEVHQASHFYPIAELRQLPGFGTEMTIAEAVEAAGGQVTASTLKNQLLAGRIEGKKRGRDWMITSTALEEYLASRSASGRPSKPRVPSKTLTGAVLSDTAMRKLAAAKPTKEQLAERVEQLKKGRMHLGRAKR